MAFFKEKKYAASRIQYYPDSYHLYLKAIQEIKEKGELGIHELHMELDELSSEVLNDMGYEVVEDTINMGFYYIYW